MKRMTAAQMKAAFDSEDFEYRYHCDAPLGAFVTELGTRFALWAPTAQRVIVYLHHSGHEGWAYESHDLARGDRGLWTWETTQNLHGVYYGYDVTVDGETRFIADPYARACGLNGVRSMVVDLERTNPPGWQSDRAPKRQNEDIIYEIHVKDFSCDPSSGVPENWRGKYKALTLNRTSVGLMGRRPTCLNYLKKQGFTHVQLMPVYDYGSVDEGGDPDAFNWGYDPVNYNVPEGSYATDPYHGEVRIRELKEAVLSLHKNGLRVIMDVVYNHTYHLERSCLFGAVPWYYYRQNADGSASNGSGCGSEIASERSMCARYILDSVLYWAQEYHIDGFRFDLMGMLDTDLMNRIRRELDARYGEGEKLVFGEPWSGGPCAPRAGTQLAHKDNLHLLHQGSARSAITRATRSRAAWAIQRAAALPAAAISTRSGWPAACAAGPDAKTRIMRSPRPRRRSPISPPMTTGRCGISWSTACTAIGNSRPGARMCSGPISSLPRSSFAARAESSCSPARILPGRSSAFATATVRPFVSTGSTGSALGNSAR